MNKGSHITFILFLICGFFSSLSLSASQKDTIKIVILHTNDTHSRIESYPNDNSSRSGASGYARRSAYIQLIRKTEKNVLLFDAGDFFQGTPYFNFFKGEPEVKLMSDLKYDAVTLGNHEFDNGIDTLAKMLQAASFPIVVSNVDYSKTALKNKTIPYLVFKKGGIKIGVIGIFVNPAGLIDSKNDKGLQYLDPVLKANETVSLLKTQFHCDLIICLSHLGHAYPDQNIMSDSLLASSTHNIDLIIGGHSHKIISSDFFVSNLDHQKVRIVQTGANGINVGKIEYYFVKDSKNK